MRTIRCVEPALAVEGLAYLVYAEADDELLFPHVDSCLAIAFVLANGRAVGGHVAMQMPNDPDLKPWANAMSIAKQMVAACKGAAVVKLIMVGDANWESCFITQKNVIQDIIKLVGCKDTLYVDTGAYGGGVDVSLNPRRSMVFIQRCTEGRGLVFQRPYAEIQGPQVKRLD
jgi:hypothetical protein